MCVCVCIRSGLLAIITAYIKAICVVVDTERGRRRIYTRYIHTCSISSGWSDASVVILRSQNPVQDLLLLFTEIDVLLLVALHPPLAQPASKRKIMLIMTQEEQLSVCHFSILL